MAEFSRKKLKEIFEAAEIEVPKDVLSELCSLHMDVNEELVASNKNLEKELKDVKKERDDYKAQVPADGAETVSKQVYDELKTEFDTYKKNIESKETFETKEKAFRELLKNDVKISEKRLEKIIKISKSDIEDLELDKAGKIKGSEKLVESLKSEWSDFVESSNTSGTGAANPPGGNGTGGKKTREEIEAIEDRAERQAAIAQNLELFQ